MRRRPPRHVHCRCVIRPRGKRRGALREESSERERDGGRRVARARAFRPETCPSRRSNWGLRCFCGGSMGHGHGGRRQAVGGGGLGGGHRNIFVLKVCCDEKRCSNGSKHICKAHLNGGVSRPCRSPKREPLVLRRLRARAEPFAAEPSRTVSGGAPSAKAAIPRFSQLH